MSFLLKWLGLQSESQVDGREAKRLVGQGAVLLDVRTDAEAARGTLPGALVLPLAELTNRLGEVPAERPIVVFCRSGQRSARAVKLLEAAGRTHVHDLGPMSAWPR